MYLVYLNHYDRGEAKAWYLNMYYCMLPLPIKTHFIISKEYIAKYSKQTRWEVSTALEHYKTEEELYKAVTNSHYTIMNKPEEFINEVVPSKLLNKTVNGYYPEQITVIEDILSKEKIKAGITWVNNVCFRDTLRKYNIQTFHHETGPFRPSTYISTFYLDFNGVNGNTEFNKRFTEFLRISNEVPILSREELIKVISPNNSEKLLSVLYNTDRQYDAGVGMQVETDTNVLLYNNGCHWTDPLLLAVVENNKVLVRPHPCSRFTLKNRYGVTLDDSKDAIDFINKCNTIYCLNSSIGIEALLLGRKVKMLGDSPFSSLCNMDEDTLIKALNFTIFGYLVTEDKVYNNEYYEYRLNNIGNEKDIYLHNMKDLVK